MLLNRCHTIGAFTVTLLPVSEQEGKRRTEEGGAGIWGGRTSIRSHRACTGPLHPAKPVPPPPQCHQYGKGSAGGANLRLTSKARFIINDLFLIRLFGPSQPCSGIFGTGVSEEKQTSWQEDEFPTYRLGRAEIIT